jgi:transposase
VGAAAADRSYDSDAIRADLNERGIEPVIPPRACRTEAIRYDKKEYRQRNQVERLFKRLKQFRRVATRYDKLHETFLAFIHLTDALVMIRIVRQHALGRAPQPHRPPRSSSSACG